MTNVLLTCTTCNNIFRSHYDLNYHVKRHHQLSVKVKFDNGHVIEIEKGDDDMFECKCGKKFKAPTSLRKHAKNCRDGFAKLKRAEGEVELADVNNSDASESMDIDSGAINDTPIDCFRTLISYENC